MLFLKQFRRPAPVMTLLYNLSSLIIKNSNNSTVWLSEIKSNYFQFNEVKRERVMRVKTTGLMWYIRKTWLLVQWYTYMYSGVYVLAY